MLTVKFLILFSIYYFFKKKRMIQHEEHEKIKAYGERINQETRIKKFDVR